MSRPSKNTRPRVGASSRTIRRPTVLLPQPDSPTRPKEWPAPIAKLTPSTACATPTRRRNSTPRDTGKCLVSPLTAMRGGASIDLPFSLTRYSASHGGGFYLRLRRGGVQETTYPVARSHL